MAENIPKIDEKLNKLRPFRVSIEGNIAAGKSTILNYFSKMPDVEIYPEPINWWCDLNGHNLLNLLYTDINKWYSVFQQYVQLTRIQVQTSQAKYHTTTTQIFERSIQNNRYCFVEQARQAGFLKPSEFDVLEEWFQWIEDNIDIDIDFIVYLRTSPEVAYERIKNRNRKEETTITFDYIQDLHESHEKWLLSNDSNINKNKLLTIDANLPIDKVLEQCEFNKDKIISKHLILNSNRSRNILNKS